MGRMLRILIFSMVTMLGLSGSAAAAPDEWSKTVIQLADAAGVLSSRSCRDAERAERAEQAAQVLSHLLHYATQTKRLDYAAGRKYRRNAVIPTIRANRGLSHSSRDCDAALEVVRVVIKTWNVPEDARTVNSAATGGIGAPADGSLPTAPMLGATRSDKLTDAAGK